MLLQNSLGGNSKTAMIATIKLDKANKDITVGTLKFALETCLVQTQAEKQRKLSLEE